MATSKSAKEGKTKWYAGMGRRKKTYKFDNVTLKDN